MVAMIWHAAATKLYESGVQKGAFYVQDATALYPLGVPWQGITAITEKPTGAEVTKKYADNIEYATLVSDEMFAATLEAMMYPEEFDVCQGNIEAVPGLLVAQQNRPKFGMAYRTEVGNDIEALDYGYKLHLVYGLLAAPSERANASVNETPETMSLSWELTSTPVETTGYKPTSHMIINSKTSDAALLAAFELILDVDRAASRVDGRDDDR